jgi:predicted alpha/beta hydrolase
MRETEVLPLNREPIDVRCADGWMLRGELVSDGSAPPVAVAVVGHAMMVNRRTLDRPRGRGFVSTLAAHQLAVLNVDLRGHGESGPRAGDGGDWSYDDLVDGDCAALLAFARARFPSLPVVAVGHSLFAHVALAHLARHADAPLDGLVLVAANMPNPSWSIAARLAKRPLIEAMSLLARLYGRLPVRRLGLGSDDEARGYVSDFVRFARSGAWHARDGFDYWAALPSVTRPVLALAGAGDRFMAPPAEVGALVAPLLQGKLRVVGPATGLPFAPGHMGIVLDERARPAWVEVAEFVRTCPRSPR